MVTAYDLGMTTGEYVFYTIDMLPETEVLNPESVWKRNDQNDEKARQAFEAVFHVSVQYTYPQLPQISLYVFFGGGEPDFVLKCLKYPACRCRWQPWPEE